MNKKKYSNDEELNAFCQDLLQSVKEMKDKEYSNRECKNICVWGLSLSNRYGMEIA